MKKLTKKIIKATSDSEVFDGVEVIERMVKMGFSEDFAKEYVNNSKE